MKKFLSMLLIFAMLFTIYAPAYASKKQDDNPTVLISGFLCSQLYLDYGTENEENVWKATVRRVTDYAKKDFKELAKSFAFLAVGKTEYLGKSLGNGAEYILELFRCNPDGSSAYNLTYYPNNPETSNLEYMYKNGLENRLYEKNFCRYLSQQTDPAKVYCFQYDSRLDAVTVANSLRDFIEAVKKYNNAEKVNIFALSFGGLITSTYLTLYEGDNSVEKVVLSVPAIGGTNIPDRIFRGDISLPIKDLAMFAETILEGESNLARLFEGSVPDKLNSVISLSCGGFANALKNWGSIWSLCSDDLYESLKNDYLDPVENAEIINKNDMLHYEIKPRFTSVYNRLIENGGLVSIICATGSKLIAGGNYNGDFILPVEKVSGAICTLAGERFPDGYAGKKSVCANPGHNHISPSREIDASTSYLPENTWFVEGQYHGQYFYEDYTRSLVTKLLFTDEIKDVHSDPDYPQFSRSDNPYRSIDAKFNSSPSGILENDDRYLKIRNLSDENYIVILAVTSYGAELDFDIGRIGIVEPGEEASIGFSGVLPHKSASAAQITVSYLEIGSLNPFCISDFAFTVNNGDAPEYDENLEPSDFESNLKKAFPESVYEFISKSSFRQSIECIYNAIKEMIKK